MTKEGRTTGQQPFAEAFAKGLRFTSRAHRRAGIALERAWRANSFPVVLTGPRGLGKKTAVRTWLAGKPRGSVTAVTIDASRIDRDDPAASILLAFGHRPAGGASAAEALSDFLEDVAFEGRPGVVVITDLQDAPDGLWPKLLTMTRARGEGGLSLPLCVTSTEVFSGATPTVLPRLTKDELHRFAHQFLPGGRSISADLTEELVIRSGGLPARAGAIIDAYDFEEDDSENAAANEVQEELTPEERASPTPEDIERALLALGEEEAGKDAMRRPVQFPKIATGVTPELEADPANDLPSQLMPRIAADLEAVASDVAALQGHLVVVKEQATALSQRIATRGQRRVAAAEAFVKSLRSDL